MDTIKPSVMFLEYIGEHPGFSIYNISGTGSGNNETGQILKFYHENNSIEFIMPFSADYEYLNQNIKWLRSILFTVTKVKDKKIFNIPFTFPASENIRHAPEDALKVYSDGSCSENGTGGWASVILKPDGVIHELSGSEEDSTSNRMELMAAFNAINKGVEMFAECGKKQVLLFTDSLYVIKGITHRLEVWQANGFITAKGTPVTNIDLWMKISGILDGNEIFCEWIESGGNNVYHKRCDFLAGEESRKTRSCD